MSVECLQYWVFIFVLVHDSGPRNAETCRRLWTVRGLSRKTCTCLFWVILLPKSLLLYHSLVELSNTRRKTKQVFQGRVIHRVVILRAFVAHLLLFFISYFYFLLFKYRFRTTYIKCHFDLKLVIVTVLYLFYKHAIFHTQYVNMFRPSVHTRFHVLITMIHYFPLSDRKLNNFSQDSHVGILHIRNILPLRRCTFRSLLSYIISGS
jgi:hypothetical protein